MNDQLVTRVELSKAAKEEDARRLDQFRRDEGIPAGAKVTKAKYPDKPKAIFSEMNTRINASDPKAERRKAMQERLAQRFSAILAQKIRGGIEAWRNSVPADMRNKKDFKPFLADAIVAALDQ